MKLFGFTLLITFPTFCLVALLINHCRKKLRKTPHGLSGMCHSSGDAMCSGCREKMQSDHSETLS